MRSPMLARLAAGRRAGELGPLLVSLAVTAGAVVILMLLTFWYAMRTRAHVIMDTVWPLGFVMIAAVSFVLSAGQGDLTRRALALGLTAVWGLRLAGYMFAGTTARGRAAVRFAAAAQPREPRGLRAPLHLRQAGADHVARLAARPGGDVRARPGRRGHLAGVAVWAAGFCFETVGDAQLRRFRSDPANAGRVLDRGLWRYTRHPNYFGDAVLWFGLWLLACSHWLGLLTVVSPLYLTNMLVRHTGKRLLEKHMARSKGGAYADYVRRTSGFLPRPPRPAHGRLAGAHHRGRNRTGMG